MREQRGGTIVSISSGGARSCPIGAGHYAATKAALEALSAEPPRPSSPLSAAPRRRCCSSWGPTHSHGSAIR
jgi:hypothetical protein